MSIEKKFVEEIKNQLSEHFTVAKESMDNDNMYIIVDNSKGSEYELMRFYIDEGFVVTVFNVSLVPEVEFVFHSALVFQEVAKTFELEVVLKEDYAFYMNNETNDIMVEEPENIYIDQDARIVSMINMFNNTKRFKEQGVDLPEMLKIGEED